MATDIGTRIKRARERMRWTQRQLAEALQVDRKTVDNWENGRTTPRSSIAAIEAVLGVSLAGEPPPVSPVPPDLVALIRRRFPAELQQEAIEALEDILAPPTGPGEGDRTDPSRPSRRAS